MDEWAFVLISASHWWPIASERQTGASYPDGRAIPPWGTVGTGSALVLRTPQKNIETFSKPS
jgi:hypothetical protein